MALKDFLPGSRTELVRVLEADPTLAADLATEDAEAARGHAIAPLLVLEPGAWSAPKAQEEAGELGLLVLDGLLERDVVLAGVGCTELMGAGDLIRPWEQDEGAPSLPFEVQWAALEPTRLAVLDARFVAVIGRWPTVVSRLTGRSARLTQSLAVHFAITCFVGLELRLYVLLWHLADRFGHVERDGVAVPLRLTHDTLGRLVRARRPSVTAALRQLTERGLVTRRDDGSWLLHGAPPEEFDRLRSEVSRAGPERGFLDARGA